MKKTSIVIDENTAEKAKAVLGAKTLTETVDLSFKEVIAHEARRKFILRMVDMNGLELDNEDVMKQAWR
ncbi:MAG: type II toxin-antitoxin system VapB family antitoxin [Actinobacteria bacterium]|nr:type II toxin-antitoxin system VapB family antitoxin [Actinomycetota bacterium]MCL6104200.1 type II toxin-antitoxin system VapB family antitoxin [Actinomycetota bacterium]